MAAGAGDGGDVPLLDADLGVDSDLAADETPKKKKQNTGSGSKKAKDAADAELECFLCEQAGDLDKEFRTEVVHSCCLNAIRCHLRMLKTVENKADDHLLFKDKLPEWRAMILPLVVVGDAHRTRKMVARHAAGVETKLFREEALSPAESLLERERWPSSAVLPLRRSRARPRQSLPVPVPERALPERSSTPSLRFLTERSGAAAASLLPPDLVVNFLPVLVVLIAFSATFTHVSPFSSA